MIAFATAGVASTIGAHFDGLYNLPDGQTLAEAVKAGTQSLKFSIEIGRAMAHGLSGGVFSELGGGDFGGGFAAGAFGSLAGSAMTTAKGQGFFGLAGDGDFTGLTKRTVAAAIVGGTAAEIGGGKFANGAATAGIQHLFNAEGLGKTTKPRKTVVIATNGDPDDLMASIIEDRYLRENIGEWNKYLEVQGLSPIDLHTGVSSEKAMYSILEGYRGQHVDVLFITHGTTSGPQQYAFPNPRTEGGTLMTESDVASFLKDEFSITTDPEGFQCFGCTVVDGRSNITQIYTRYVDRFIRKKYLGD